MSIEPNQDDQHRGDQEAKKPLEIIPSIRQKERNRKPVFIKIILPVVIVILLNLAYQNISQLLEDQNWYRLKKIEFVGLKKLDPYKLVKYLDLKKDSNLLFFDEYLLSEKIQKWDRLKQAKVYVEYPDTLHIELEERNPEFLIRIGNSNDLATITSDLKLVASGEEVVSYDLFVIEVSGVRDVESALRSQNLNRFMEIYHRLPKKEQDIINIFSGVKLAPEIISQTEVAPIKASVGYRENTLYTDEGRLVVRLSELTFSQVRKARYAFLYVKSKQLQVSEIKVRDDWVVLKVKESDQKISKRIKPEDRVL